MLTERKFGLSFSLHSSVGRKRTEFAGVGLTLLNEQKLAVRACFSVVSFMKMMFRVA